MALFKITGQKLNPVKDIIFSSYFDKEKKLQSFTENNLEELFGLEFISTEFNLETFWLDSLAFDPELKSFVIIEYKKVENLSLMDQGQTYLNLVLDHKADVLLEYINKKGKTIKKHDVDWSQTRVIFVGPRFNTYQKRALSPNLPFELWEVALYDGELIEYDQIIPTGQTGNKDKKSLSGSAAREIETFTVEDHLKRSTQDIQDIFQKIREQILLLDTRVQEKPVKNYIGYKVNWYNFCTIHFYREKLKIHVRKEVLNSDKDKRFDKVPSSYEWGKTPIWWMDVSTAEDIDYIFPAIKESYESAPDKK
ncbi:MAG: hypothetical protein COY68_05050 [Candidatus Levybacteria bacterium CG_4_10_14_0_8_um_filter_35_23]|nr:MAG: hypothetical protein COY68_05050 [Candidatus Levybacteria bacterium CG_4_10_14_0_8_um_filter_35_23]